MVARPCWRSVHVRNRPLTFRRRAAEEVEEVKEGAAKRLELAAPARRREEFREEFITDYGRAISHPQLWQNLSMRELSRRSWMAGVALASQAASREVVRLPKKVRLAIIGLEGHTSEILAPLDQLPDVELAAVWDRDPKVAHDFAGSKHGRGARAYSSWRELLDREKLEIVGICGTCGSCVGICWLPAPSAARPPIGSAEWSFQPPPVPG